MRAFTTYLTEGRAFRRKGWVNVKTGKMVLWAYRGKSIRPFHSEYVLNNMKKFYRNEDQLLQRFASLSGFDAGDPETMDMWNDIKSGEVDRDKNLDSLMNEDGWFRVVFDEGLSSIETNTPQQASKVVQIVTKKIKWDDIQSLYIYDKGFDDRFEAIEIYNPDDAAIYAKTGRLPKRTEIGRTMAMFRESYKGEMLIGWATPKGKLHLYPEGGRMGKFHSQILTNLFPFEKFREFMGDKIGDSIRSDMQQFVDDGFITQDKLEVTVRKSYESVYNAMLTGKSDGHWETEENFQKAGWVKIRIDRRSNGNSLLAGSRRGCQQIARLLDKKLGGWSNLTGHKFWINADNTSENITDQDTWKTYMKTGRVPRRTSIGRTMSQFRESAGDKDLFRGHWKKAPVMTSGATDVKKRNAHWDAYFKHFEDKYGEIPKRIKNAMRTADYKTNPSVTYKGKKFKLRTGMDELDLLYHVLSEDASSR